jgi:hypothetical protein
MDDDIEACAVMLAKLWSKERDYPFWGNEVHRFRGVVKQLVIAERVPVSVVHVARRGDPHYRAWP